MFDYMNYWQTCNRRDRVLVYRRIEQLFRPQEHAEVAGSCAVVYKEVLTKSALATLL